MINPLTFLYALGSNQYGQLGLADKQLDIPKSVHYGVTILKVACGAHFTLLQVESLQLYGMGSNLYQNLGPKGGLYYSQPHLLEINNVTDIACGAWHSLAISNGKVYSWGCNEDGQLGLGDCQLRCKPTQIQIQAAKVACGLYHSFAYDTTQIFAFGRGSDGQLFGKPNSLTPISILLKGIRQIAAGETTSLVLYDDGILQNTISINIDDQIQSVACGKYECSALSANGSLYLWKSEEGNKDIRMIGRDVRLVVMFGEQSFVQKTDGSVFEGFNKRIPFNDPIDSIYAGESHSLFITALQKSHSEYNTVQSSVSDLSISLLTSLAHVEPQPTPFIELIKKDKQIAELQLQLAQKDAIIADLMSRLK